MIGLPKPYLRAASFRVLLSYTEVGLSRELFPSEDDVVKRWRAELKRLLSAAQHLLACEKNHLRPTLHHLTNHEWEGMVYERVVGVWQWVVTWLTRGTNSLDSKLENVDRLAAATVCVAAARRALRHWQEWAVQAVVDHCEGREKFKSALDGQAYMDLHFPDTPSESSITLAELLRTFREHRDALLAAEDRDDRERCKASRAVVSDWQLLRTLYPQEWTSGVHTDLLRIHRRLAELMTVDELRESVRRRLRHLHDTQTDEQFRKDTILLHVKMEEAVGKMASHRTDPYADPFYDPPAEVEYHQLVAA